MKSFHYLNIILNEPVLEKKKVSEFLLTPFKADFFDVEFLQCLRTRKSMNKQFIE